MNMRAPSLIHNLTFDISCAGAADDGLAMADWIKEALLPVMEEVFDQHDQPGRIRRIAQLEIDLGTVSREESRGELARRLFAQMSGALGTSLEDATDISLVEERERQVGVHLLDFLRTGRLDWSVAADGRVAHRQLLLRVLESSRAAEVLRTAINDPRMLARLLHQFDAADLNSVAQLLSRSWPERESGAVFAFAAAPAAPVAAAAGDDQKAYWRRRLLQASARPSAERRHREGLLQLSQMRDRDALRQIWRQLLDEVRQRIGKRGMSALNPEAMTDLALILRPRAQQLFAEHGGKWQPSQIDTVLQLLLAGEGAVAAVTLMLASPSEQPPATPLQQSHDEVYRLASPRPRPDVAAANGVAGPSTMSPPADADADAVAIAASPSMRASPHQPAAELLTRAWRTFSREQRATFQYIWQRLSEELADHAGGREVSTLTAKQKSDLALILQPQAAALMKELQDDTSLVEAVVQLLLASNDASATVQSMFTNASDPLPAIQTAARHAENHNISSPESQKSSAVLALLWEFFRPEQRVAFHHLWQRLSEAVADRVGGRDAATPTDTKKSSLALIVRPRAHMLLRELRHQDEASILDAVVQLLLAADDASTVMQAGARPPATQTTAREQPLNAEMNQDISSPAPQKHLSSPARAWDGFSPEQRDVFGDARRLLSEEFASRTTGRYMTTLPVSQKVASHAAAGNENHSILSTNPQKSLALLTRIWDAFSVKQRIAFRHMWRRLSEEVDSLDVAMLNAAQRTDLAMILRPQAATLLKEPGHQDEAHLLEAVVQLLLTADETSAAVQALITSASAQITPSEQPDAAANHSISSPDTHKSLAVLARQWATLNSQQRAAFRHVWQRLSEEALDRADGRDLATLNVTQKSGLAMSLQPRVDTLLKELGHQGHKHLVVAIVQLLLSDDASNVLQGLFASPSDQTLAQREEPAAEANHATASADTPNSLALLARLREGFNSEQHATFSRMRQRHSEESSSRAGGRDVPTLDATHISELALKIQIVEAVLQLLLAGDNFGSAVPSMLANPSQQPPMALPEEPGAGANSYQPSTASPERSAEQRVAFDPVRQRLAGEEPQSAIDPSLAAFHDWQQGRLDIFTLTIVLQDLRQWINWWLLHDPRQVNKNRSLMLEAIDAKTQQVTDPILFTKLVLVDLKAGGALDLDALSRQAGPEYGNEHAMPPAPIASPLPAVKTLNFVDQQTHLDDLNSAQLHHIIRSKIQRPGDEPSLFLDAIEAYALRATSIPALFRKVLQRLMADQSVDLEQLLADTDYQTPPASGDFTAAVYEEAPAPATASALPEQLRQALPQRLANAMLQANLASLEIIWPEITRAHTTELAAAAQRYLSRADLRARLIEHTETSMLKDLLAALSPPAARLIEPILRHSAQYSAMLPTRLSVHEFEQRVLRYAYEQALKPDISPTEWLHALMSSVQEMNPDQRKQLQHAWHEVLRAEKKPASLLTVLEQTLFEHAEGRRDAPEPAASLLLMRQAELDATDHASLTSLLKNIGNETDGSLESALSDPQALDRLTELSPTPILARMFALLKPTLAAQLPTLLRQLQKALPISLAPVPATLDRRIWRAIYQSAFTVGNGPDDFLPAMVTRLATQYLRADPSAWLEKIVGMATTTPASTLEHALAQLLQPWAEQNAESPPRKPAPAKRDAEEAQLFTGESNIHNAGMMIIAPYIQRLFNLLDLTADGKFVSDDAAQRGVHLLQYAVTGEESTPEYQLVLNKLLCGIHGGVPIAAGINITDKEKATIEQMLTGVITHWSALGSTSIAGLRETFLQRQGHLYFQEDAWQLKIPTKTFDMLLDRLPWSFAMTKMPWMAQPLHVTWR